MELEQTVDDVSSESVGVSSRVKTLLVRLGLLALIASVSVGLGFALSEPVPTEAAAINVVTLPSAHGDGCSMGSDEQQHDCAQDGIEKSDTCCSAK